MEHPGYGFDAKFQMPLKKVALTCSMIGRWTCVGVEFSLLILSVADSAPVELIGIVYPLFTSFYASLVAQDFFHQQHERALTKSVAIFFFQGSTRPRERSSLPKKNEKNIWRALRWLEARINLFWK